MNSVFAFVPHSLSPQFRPPYSQLPIRISEPVGVGSADAGLPKTQEQQAAPGSWVTRHSPTPPVRVPKSELGVGNREFGIGEIGSWGTKAN